MASSPRSLASLIERGKRSNQPTPTFKFQTDAQKDIYIVPSAQVNCGDLKLGEFVAGSCPDQIYLPFVPRCKIVEPL